MLAITKLQQHFSRHGQVEWIGLRPSEDNRVLEVSSAELLIGHGLAGDKAGQHSGSKRQVL